MWKINVSGLFLTFRLKMHVRCDNQYKTGADRGNILGQLMLLECMGICILSPLHECEMRGSLVYQLIVKCLSTLFKFRHSILDWTVLLWNSGGEWLGGGVKTFLEGSVNHIINGDYIVSRSSLIYCSLVLWRAPSPKTGLNRGVVSHEDGLSSRIPLYSFLFLPHIWQVHVLRQTVPFH